MFRMHYQPVNNNKLQEISRIIAYQRKNFKNRQLQLKKKEEEESHPKLNIKKNQKKNRHKLNKENK
uniref:Uncharacterized protein n=1 Tax=Rhizophora mucronata TaxID=61149 RepID=A0A2P2QMN6_RHIMU